MEKITSFFSKKKVKNYPLLITEKYPNKDFFIADIFDNLPIKDDLASMEHPIFSLSTKKDVRDLEYHYENKETGKNIEIKIKPNSSGLPTIFDKDILLFCGSLLMAEINKGNIPPKTLRVSPYDFFVTTNRLEKGNAGGERYKLLKESLERLKGVSIITNIKTNKITQTSGFGLIDRYNIVKSSRVGDRMIRLEITLSDWFYNSIVGKEVITINRNYFRLRQPLERRLYEIATKHIGQEKEFRISVEKLYAKSGSKSTLSKFNFSLKKIVAKNVLPDLDIKLEDDIAIFTSKKGKMLEYNKENKKKVVSDKILEQGKKMTIAAGTSWDFDVIVEEFALFSMKNPPDNYEKAFIGFVKKKVANRP